MSISLSRYSLVLAIAAAIVSGCSNGSDPENEPGEPGVDGLAVAQYSSVDGSGDDAALIGELKNENGCLLLSDEDGHMHIVVLPANEFEVRADDDGPLLEVRGAQVRVGDSVLLGGGGSSRAIHSDLDVPDECGGHDQLWFVSGVRLSAPE